MAGSWVTRPRLNAPVRGKLKRKGDNPVVDHDDKPVPEDIIHPSAALVITGDELSSCTRFGKTCIAYVHRMGGHGLRAQYKCLSARCGRSNA